MITPSEVSGDQFRLIVVNFKRREAGQGDWGVVFSLEEAEEFNASARGVSQNYGVSQTGLCQIDSAAEKQTVQKCNIEHRDWKKVHIVRLWVFSGCASRDLGG